MWTTFGALPIGALFTVKRWERLPQDRRRKGYRLYSYTKKAQGTIAGWAQAANETARFSLSHRVYVDPSDFRLTVECLRNSHKEMCI